MEFIKNPFKGINSDQAVIWEMLVYRDIKAFVNGDWNQIENDFLSHKFYGINALFSLDPQIWKLDFPLLADYKKSWLDQAHESKRKTYAESLETGIHRVTKLDKFEIKSGKAAIWKKFNGTLKLSDGQDEVLQWQTIYFCEFFKESWKIAGFIGYLPL